MPSSFLLMTCGDARSSLKGFVACRTLSGFRRFLIAIPRLSLRSNPGPELANAFGVFKPYHYLNRKYLTRSLLILYTRQFAPNTTARSEDQISMLMTRTYKEHSMKWRPCGAMYRVVCSLGLPSSAPNIFGSRLEQRPSIDSPNSRH